jgi:ketosteroid isomerase-like protein
LSDIVELARAWLDTFGEGRFDAFPGRISPDFVLRLPFVPPGIPNEFRGREKVRETMVATARGRSRLEFSDIVIRRTEDPDLLVITARGQATMASGTLYRNEYVILLRIHDGEVLEHTEYLNPLAVMELMQG